MLLNDYTKRDQTFFNSYNVGMGNLVFLNKKIPLKVGDGYIRCKRYLTFNRNDRAYKVFSSVPAVFDVVAYLINT